MAFKYRITSASLEEACKNNAPLKHLLQDVLNWQGAFVNVSGIDPLIPAGTQGVQSLQPPSVVANVLVEAVDSTFQITITPPLNTIGVLYYLVESSQTLPFEASLTLKQYNVMNGYMEVTSPSDSRYWRVRARFTNSIYGPAFITPLVST